MKTITFQPHRIEEETALVVMQRIQNIISDKGKCVLALSGGRNPKGLYELLSRDLSADNLEIILVDERIVSPENELSNELFLRRCFSGSPLGEKIHFYPTEEEDCFERSQMMLERFEQIDLVLLGLGHDGHTASLFTLEDTMMEGRIVQVQKKGEDFKRISLSYQELLKVPQIIFYVRDLEKAPMVKNLLDPKSAVKYPAGKLLWEHHDASIISLE